MTNDTKKQARFQIAHKPNSTKLWLWDGMKFMGVFTSLDIAKDCAVKNANDGDAVNYYDGKQHHIVEIAKNREPQA